MLKNKWSIIGITLLIIISLCFGLKTCTSKNKSTKTGSSNNNAFSITAPSNLTATTISPSQINLSWQDDSNNEDGFEIYRSIDGINYALISTVNTNISFYSDTITPSLTIYYYRVRAFNTIGDRSAYSNGVNAVTVLSKWRAIAAGESHSLALNTNSTLWGWGNNQFGQLDPSNFASPFIQPTLLNPDTDWSRIAAGYNHTLAIKTDSTLWTWGENEFCQLGLGNTEFYPVPTRVGTDLDWSLVAGGGAHSVAVKTNGTICSWGYNNTGQLGLGDTLDRYTPSFIGTDSDWSSVTCGYPYTLAIKNNGTLWAWGYNWFGQLGDGSNTNMRTTPRQVGSDSDWSAIAVGYDHSIGLKTQGTLWAWGSNQYGQLGLNNYTNRTTPARIGNDSDWAAISADGNDVNMGHTLALKTNRTLWSWGYNGLGQLGVGDTNQSPVSLQITYPSEYQEDWAMVCAGGAHALGQTTDGTLWIWGGNSYGQLGIANTINQNIPINLNLPQPGNLIAAVITWTEIALFWRDNSDRETGFQIERSFDDINYTLLSTISANTTLYTDTTVTRGNTYYYRIKTLYGVAESIYSDIASGITIIWHLKIGQPSARYGHSMVWDPIRQRVIIFGGFDDVDYKNDLWWYEPGTNTWTEKITNGAVDSPSPRRFHSMVWDPIEQKVIMFGGYGTSPTYKNDLWWYDPASGTNGAWLMKIDNGTPSPTLPSARDRHSMVWDTVGQRVIMFGGYGGANKNDLWWYEPISNTWTMKIDQDVVGSPSARRYHSMVWGGQSVIMFGGSAAGGFKNDLWWYEPVSNTWIQQYTSVTPSARYGHSLVWDPIGSRVIMFGGFASGDASEYKNDLWWYEPVQNTWSKKITQGIAGSPPARYWHSMVWDPIEQRLIMFGGYDGSSWKNDLWWWW
jgi:alpha-tubulin suppressor-like RCC1 family protein